MKDLNELLLYNPCKEGLAYVRYEHNGNLQEAWESCERLDWMLWFISRKPENKKVMIQFAKDCAKHVEHLDNYYSREAAIYAATYAVTYAVNYATYAVTYAANTTYDIERSWQISHLKSLINPFQIKSNQ